MHKAERISGYISRPAPIICNIVSEDDAGRRHKTTIYVDTPC